MTFLCHIIFSEGVDVDQRKTEAVKNLPTPSTPMDIIKSFLGLGGYYRSIVEGLHLLHIPLLLLPKSLKKFSGRRYGLSFQILKYRLTSAPVLKLSKGTNWFVVYCNASCVGFGYVLMQHGNVITYSSRQLKSMRETIRLMTIG